MPQQITKGYRALVDAAQRDIETLAIEDAMKLHGRHDVVFVDLRDIRELNRDGRIPGAFHCPRGMLEFWVDPQSAYHKPVFAEDKRSCSSAMAAGARHSRRKPRSRWASSRWHTSPVASAPGRRQAGR